METRVARGAIAASLLPLLCIGCANFKPFQPFQSRPAALPASPDFNQVSTLVNANASRVQSITARGAKVSSPSLPLPLSADIAVQRPYNVRIKANSLLGPEADLGSNSDLFWLWAKRGQPQVTYVCRHDEFAASMARQVMPVDPKWIVEAFGLATLDPQDQHQGPAPVGQNRLRIDTVKNSVVGPVRKVTIIDQRYGDVLEQHIYDANQQLVASALTSDHRLDPVTGAWLPRSVELKWPQTQMSVRVDMSALEVNAVTPQQTALFAKPDYPGYADFNLANPNFRLFNPLPSGGGQQQTNLRPPTVVRRPRLLPAVPGAARR